MTLSYLFNLTVCYIFELSICEQHVKVTALISWREVLTNFVTFKGEKRDKMHSLLLRPGLHNIISLWCKLCHTIDIHICNYRSSFPFWDKCLVFIFFIFLETSTQRFCKRHYVVVVITKIRHVLYAGTCTWVDKKVLKLLAYLCEYSTELYETYTKY